MSIDLNRVRVEWPLSLGEPCVPVIHELADEIERLRTELMQAATSLSMWGSYATEHHQKRWDLAGDIARIRAAAGQVGEPA
jgi:hypothetical protein